jgi:hypothetical protein
MARDYILRLIEQVAAMLSGITGLRKAGHLDEARREIDKLSLETIGLPLATVKGLSPESIGQLLEDAGALRCLRSIKLAELLIADAEIYPGGPDAPACWVHATCLLADSMKALNRDEQEIYRPKLEILTSRLGSWQDHPYIAEKLRAAAP